MAMSFSSSVNLQFQLSNNELTHANGVRLNCTITHPHICLGYNSPIDMNGRIVTLSLLQDETYEFDHTTRRKISTNPIHYNPRIFLDQSVEERPIIGIGLFV
ncbi:unnamed protein product [Gordionus sp. m RMFG-2023]